MEKVKVYFCKELTPENVIKVYKMLGKELVGKVTVKVHSGEEGNQNYLKPEFWKPIIEYVNGTVVECNTAYAGERNTTEKHLKTIEKHGWNKYFEVDLLDEEGPDLEIELPNGKTRVVLEGLIRADVNEYIKENKLLSADITILEDEEVEEEVNHVVSKKLKKEIENYIKIVPYISNSVISSI